MNKHMKYTSPCKRKTMRRVYSIWFMRRVLPIITAELVVLGAIIVGARGYMSFGNIMENALYKLTHHSIMSFGSFVVSAFSHTEFMSLLLVGGGLLMLGLMAREVFRTGRNYIRTPSVISR